MIMSRGDGAGRKESWGNALSLTPGAEAIDREIERLKVELEQAKGKAEESFLSLNESGALISLGVLGVLGSAWAVARLLQSVLPPELIANTDFMASVLLSAQKGLGTRGGVAAAGLGWLLLISLAGHHLWRRLTGTEMKGGAPLWAGWVFGGMLAVLPFYRFQTNRPQVSVLVGLAIVSGIYVVVALLQHSDQLARFFSWLGESWFGAAFGGTTLVVILTGILLPSPRALLAGILLASGLSLKALLLGIRKLAKTREIRLLRGQINFLLNQRVSDEEKRRVRDQLDQFMKSGTTQPV